MIFSIYQQMLHKELHILYKSMFIKHRKQQTQIGCILQCSILLIIQAVIMIAIAFFCASYCLHLSQTKYFLIKTAPAGSINNYGDEQKESARLTEEGNI